MNYFYMGSNKYFVVKDFLPVSDRSLVSDDPAEFKNFISSQKYDVVVVGSDAIWNDNQTSRPNMYLLHDVSNVRKLSYAASTYGMDYSAFTVDQMQYVEESLQEFEFLGVRDSVSDHYIRHCSGGRLSGIHTCDPSVFLDLDQVPVELDRLKEKMIAQGVTFKKPIIGLMCSEWLARKVRKELGNDYEYVSVYYDTGVEDVFMGELTPFEWSRIFSFFDVTFTHFFHGTLFSIRNGTRTFSIERGSAYKSKYQTKIQDVLGRLELLNECYYEDDKMTESDWGNIRKSVVENDKEITKAKYAQRISKEKQTAETFMECLEGILK